MPEFEDADHEGMVGASMDDIICFGGEFTLACRALYVKLVV